MGKGTAPAWPPGPHDSGVDAFRFKTLWKAKFKPNLHITPTRCPAQELDAAKQEELEREEVPPLIAPDSPS